MYLRGPAFIRDTISGMTSDQGSSTSRRASVITTMRTLGLQFFKVWDHVGDRYDDLRNYSSDAQRINHAVFERFATHWHPRIVM